MPGAHAARGCRQQGAAITPHRKAILNPLPCQAAGGTGSGRGVPSEALPSLPPPPRHTLPAGR